MKNMIKRLFFSLMIIVTCVATANATGNDDYDEFDFDNFAISDSVDTDFKPVSSNVLNDGAMPANVSSFDIAGIMLGMTFDDVYTLEQSTDTINKLLCAFNFMFGPQGCAISTSLSPIITSP